MPFPSITDLARRLYDQAAEAQAPGADEERGWPLAKLTGALLDDADWAATALDPDEEDPAGGRLLDPDETPSGFVRWLGQFHGVRVTKGAAELVQRDEVKTAAGRKRGRGSALVADVRRTLTGTKTVGVVNRLDGSRWRVAIRTRPSETPDSAATLLAILNQKPYGIVLTIVEDELPMVAEYTRAMDDITVDLDVATLADVT